MSYCVPSMLIWMPGRSGVTYVILRAVYVNMDARAEWCNICHTACSSMLIWMPGQSGVTYVILRAVYVNMDARAEWCNICHTACRLC